MNYGNHSETRKESPRRNAYWQDRRLWWIALGLLTLLLRWALRGAPQVIEAVYSRGIFIAIRTVLSSAFGWLPFSIMWLLLPGLIFYRIWRWRKRRKLRQKNGIRWNWKQHLGNAGLNLSALVLGALLLFNVLWGFNYGRVPLETTLGLEVKGLNAEILCEEMEWATREAELARALIPGVTLDSLSYALMPVDLESRVQLEVEETLRSLGFPALVWGRVRARVVPGGGLLRVSISGIYNPFVGEGVIAGATTPQRYPATMAHEMAHGYGFGNEGTCNFLAIVACTRSADPLIRYSGWMSYWYYVGKELNKVDPLLYVMLRRQIGAGFRADLRANYFNSKKYSSWFSKIGLKVNAAYLKAQGVKAGLSSYDRVSNMFAAWRRVGR